MGGGVETALDNNWSAKFEALYVDLGGFDTAFGGVTNTTVTNALCAPARVQHGHHDHGHDHRQFPHDRIRDAVKHYPIAKPCFVIGREGPAFAIDS